MHALAAAQQIAQTLAMAEVHLRQGRPREAERICRTVIAQRPGHFVALTLLGEALAATGRTEDAAQHFRLAAKANPKSPVGHANEGTMLASLGRHDEALACFDQAEKLDPRNAKIINNRGSSLAALGRTTEALAAFDRAITLDPASIGALTNQAATLQVLRRHTEAVAKLDRALTLKPDDPSLLTTRALLLQEMGRCEEALRDSDSALRRTPDDDRAHFARAAALHGLNQPEAALQSFDRALAIAPDNIGLMTSRATLLYELGQFDAALAACARAMQLNPDDAEAHFVRSTCHLAAGDLGPGWREYEWRWLQYGVPSSRPGTTQPAWRGETTLSDQTILLHAEQGFGDTLQFCRYAPLVAAQATKVVLEVPRPLVRLLGSLSDCVEIVAEGDPIPDFDLHCPLMSLPLAFGTTLGTIPGHVPYLRADPTEVAMWRSRLAPYPGLRVGLTWAGSSRLGNSRSSSLDRRRSITLAHLAGLRDLPGLSLISLQTGAASAEAGSPPAGLTIIDWTKELADFAATAALIEALDLIISVDTAVAHLAGALGRPVWTLHRHDASWRWLRGRDDSPWYPSARLFRQPTPGDWNTPISDLIRALQAICS
jgi:tetratricopeptide (TPR) repeat protein